MYDADIAYGMTQHPWRKILDQCFVTRRDAYAQSGGFTPALGHFAEWALAANYHALGLSIGYLPDARFHHPYLGELKGFRLFTLDFVQGETRYLTEAASEPGSHLIEVPGEWLTQGNFDRPLAQALSKRALRDARRGTVNSRRYETLAKAKRWLVPAIFGLAALALWAVHALFRVDIGFDMTTRDKLLVIFFATVGVNARLADLAAGGRVLGMLCLVTVVFVFLQDTVGTVGADGHAHPQQQVARQVAGGKLCGQLCA